MNYLWDVTPCIKNKIIVIIELNIFKYIVFFRVILYLI